MRQRHFPRLCRTCRAPMARQEDTCWRCGVRWASEGQPRNALRVIRGGAAQAELVATEEVVAAVAVGQEAT